MGEAVEVERRSDVVSVAVGRRAMDEMGTMCGECSAESPIMEVREGVTSDKPLRTSVRRRTEYNLEM